VQAATTPDVHLIPAIILELEQNHQQSPHRNFIHAKSLSYISSRYLRSIQLKIHVKIYLGQYLQKVCAVIQKFKIRTPHSWPSSDGVSNTRHRFLRFYLLKVTNTSAPKQEVSGQAYSKLLSFPERILSPLSENLSVVIRRCLHSLITYWRNGSSPTC
jgi:hypothetical protein